MSDFVKEAERVLLPEAEKYCPVGTESKAVIHQWLNSLAYEKPLFAQENGASADRLISVLRENGLFQSSAALVKQLHSELKLMPVDNPRFTFIDLLQVLEG